MNNILCFLADQAAGNSGLIFGKPHRQVRTCDHDINAKRFVTLKSYRDFPHRRLLDIVLNLDDVGLFEKAISLHSSMLHSDEIRPNILNHMYTTDNGQHHNLRRTMAKYEHFDFLKKSLDYSLLGVRDAVEMVAIRDSPKLREFISQNIIFGHHLPNFHDRILDKLDAEQINFILSLGLPRECLTPCALARLGLFEEIKGGVTPSTFARLGLDMVIECASRLNIDIDYEDLLFELIKHRRFDDVKTLRPTAKQVASVLYETLNSFATYVWDIEGLEALTSALGEDECAEFDEDAIFVDNEETADWCLSHLNNDQVRMDDNFRMYKWRIDRKIADFRLPIRNITSFKNTEILWLLNEGFQFELNS